MKPINNPRSLTVDGVNKALAADADAFIAAENARYFSEVDDVAAVLCEHMPGRCLVCRAERLWDF